MLAVEDTSVEESAERLTLSWNDVAEEVLQGLLVYDPKRDD